MDRPLALALVVVAFSGCTSSPPNVPDAAAADFFRPGPVAPAALPDRGIFPQGKTMHIGGYSPVNTAIKQLGGIVPLELAQKSGFTVAGPYYGAFEKSKETMERAAALGLHVAAQLQEHPSLREARKADEQPGDALKRRPALMAAIPDAELRRWVQERMNDYLNNPGLSRAVSCWVVSPEELRYWYKPELHYEQTFIKAINDLDPEHRPVFMYEPNHRTTDALLKTGPRQGFVLEGSYVHSMGWDVGRSLRINWALDQMTGAAAKDKRVVVPALQLSQDMPGFTAKDIEADPAVGARLRRLLRHDVYLAITRGAQGIQVWSLFHSRKNMTTYLDLVNGYGEVFRELTSPPANLQGPIFFGERRRDIAFQVVSGPATIAVQPKEGTMEAVEGKIDVRKGQWPSVRLANIAYGNERVLILVNSAAEQVQVRLKGVPAAARLDTISGGDAAKLETTPAGIVVALEPFAALAMRVSRSQSP